MSVVLHRTGEAEHDTGAPDTCWLAGVRARDPNALKHLYHRYRAPVIRFLSLVEPDRSPEDACLDVFEEVWYGAVVSTPDGPVAEWVLGVAYRVLLRRAQAQEPPALQAGPRHIVSGLSLEQRIVVALVYASELSIDSIEAVTGMTHAEIAGHLGKACDVLRRQAREPTRTPL